jgi:hypothetical protein
VRTPGDFADRSASDLSDPGGASEPVFEGIFLGEDES